MLRPWIAILVVAPGLAAPAQDDRKAQVDVVVREDSFVVPSDLTLRARVTAITPSEPSALHWRWGGEGLGGTPERGVLAESLPVGTWSPAVPVASFVKGKFPGKLFLIVLTGKGGSRVREPQAKGGDEIPRFEGHSVGVEMEFEVAWKGKSLKTFREKGPDGGSVGVVIPAHRLAGGGSPAAPEFLGEFTGLLDYARRRADRLEALPAAQGPRPSRYGIVTDLSGYGPSHGYAVRFTDREVLDAELRSLKVLGVNGLAGTSRFLVKEGGPFAHVAYVQLGGYPVPAARPGRIVAEAGCPFAPGVAARTKQMVDEGLAAAVRMPVDEVWWRTEDEIGTVIDRAPEGKSHFAACAACADGFRAYLKAKNVAPADLGKRGWADVRPADLGRKGPFAPADRGEALTHYQTALFSNDASAGLFTPLRDALARANEAKRRTPESKQPWIYSFALRGNTFLMGGHSLDFFDFYRRADNAMVYETSNRDARIWGWDSYLCDVGRILQSRQKIEFGVYVKPHRGAPIQRALSAASRGARLIYWYTYGPDYVKGDSFAESDAALESVARAAALLGRAEDVLVGSTWAEPPEVAVVNPRSSELWNRFTGASSAAYENAKWIYTALAHAHVPVDPLDEEMLATEDLARYRVIYVSGTHLTRAAAARLSSWVESGGTLYTSGGGLARDEANEPLTALAGALGLEGRGPVEVWAKVQAYGGSGIEAWGESSQRPAISGPLGMFVPGVGREVLGPAPGTEVVATFADGGAAMTRRAVGRGQVWVAAFFPGLEYSTAVRIEAFDMARDFDAVRRNYVTAPLGGRVLPVVDASQPLVEGVLLRNDATGRRSVTLMNWAYRVSGKIVSGHRSKAVTSVVAFKDLRVTLRGAGEVARATSVALQQPLKVERSGEGVVLTVPILEEGDVIRLE